MTPTDRLPQLLTIDQLADVLGTSVRHIRRLVAESRVPYLKVGKFVRFDPGEIAGWLDGTRHRSSEVRVLPSHRLPQPGHRHTLRGD